MATDQEIRDAGFKYIPQQKYLQNPFQLPEDQEPVVNEGIVNTNAFANSGGGNGFNPAGNAFGEGTAVSPVFGNSYIDTVRREGPDSFEAYNKLSQAGGTAPAGMFQTDYFPGTQNELVDAMGRMPGQEGYAPSMDYSEDAFEKAEDKRGFLSKLINNAKQGMTKLPDWAKTAISAAGFINPFTAVPKFLGMSTGDGGPTYGVAGLSDSQKQYYDSLASQGLLFDDSGIMKTMTGKNFMGKGYLEGQLDIYNDKFADMTEEEIEELKNDPRKQFKYKQYLESSAMFKDNQKQYDDNLRSMGASNIPEAKFAGQGGNRREQERQESINRASEQAAYDRFSRGDDSEYSSGRAGEQSDGSYNDPFDRGGGEKDGGFIDGSNRRPFAYGGLASIL